MKHPLTCLLLLATLVSSAEQAAPLVLPPGVVYSLRGISLTRELNGLTSEECTSQSVATLDVEKRDDRAQTNVLRGEDTSTGYSYNSDIGGQFSGKVVFGIIPMGSAGGGSSLSYGKRDAKQRQLSKSAASATSTESALSTEKGSTTSSQTKRELGSYKLVFAISFQGRDFNDTYRVGGENAFATLKGLSRPLKIPFRGEPFELGAEERICTFEYPVADTQLLGELLARNSQDGLSSLSIALNGYEFPIISKTKGTNILVESAARETRTPTTEIAIDFGPASALSPWRIKRRFGRSSGRKDLNLTIRDALELVNAEIAKDDEMPLVTFELRNKGLFSSGGLVKVGDLAFGKIPDTGWVHVPAMCCYSEHSAEIYLDNVTDAVLARRLSDFSQIRFVDVDLATTIERVYDSDEEYKVSEEVLRFIRERARKNGRMGKLIEDARHTKEVRHERERKERERAKVEAERRIREQKEAERKRQEEELRKPVTITIYGFGPMPFTGETFDVYANGRLIGSVTRNSSFVTDITEDTEIKFTSRGLFSTSVSCWVQKRSPKNVKLVGGLMGWRAEPTDL